MYGPHEYDWSESQVYSMKNVPWQIEVLSRLNTELELTQLVVPLRL